MISHSSDAPEYFAKPNLIGDKIFYLEHPHTGLIHEINFSWNCSKELLAFGQLLLLNSKSFRGYADTQNRIVPSSLSAARSDTVSVRYLCEKLEKDYPGRKLNSLTLEEIQTLIREYMTYGSTEVLGRSSLNGFCATLNTSYNCFKSGKLPDGMIFYIDKKLRRKCMEPILNLFGLEYAEWYEGGSYGSIPMVCCSVMLNEAIKILESDDTKIAQAFFKAFRKYPRCPTKWFEKGSNSYDMLAMYHQSLANGPPEAYKQTTIERYIYLALEIRRTGVEIPKKLPWDTLTDFGNYCELVMKAGLTVFLILSGFRIGELEPINVNDYYKKPDGSWWFDTENPKTESGAVIGRPLHGLVAKAADIMVSLSAVEPEEFNIPLFHSGFRGHAYQAVLGWGGWTIKKWISEARYSKVTLAYWFKKFYESYVLPRNPDLFEIVETVHPHQARHSFAEFSLRRFDHNVSFKIREHFRHSPKNQSFRRYTNNKIHERVHQSMEKDHLREVINRIATNHIDDRFFGPAAERIKRDLDKVSTLTPEELDNFIRDYSNLYQRFTAYEWGYCALPVKSKGAKCIDSKTGLAQIDVNSAPEVCSACPHNMSNHEQNLYLERIAIAHQDIANRHALRFVANMSNEVVRIITRRLEKNHEF